MKLLDRYVLRQVLGTALLAVAVLSVVLIMGNVFRKLLEVLVQQNVSYELLFRFIAFIIPFSLTFTIPWGFLTAVLLVFGRMSAENELIALRSSGVSMGRICAPVFALAAACVGVCFWINVQVAPRAQVAMRQALYDIATSTPLELFGGDRIINVFPGKRIFVEKNDGKKLTNVFVYELNETGDPHRMIFAESGVLEADQANEQILLHLYEARIEERDKAYPENFMRIKQGIRAQELTFPVSLKELHEQHKKKKSLTAMTVEELQQRRRDSLAKENPSPGDISAASTEIAKRYSTSLAALAFALIGVPLAITAHRRETSAGFGLSLGVAFLYFLFIIAADMVKSNPKAQPVLLAWLPNIIFIGLGLWMFRRLARR